MARLMRATEKSLHHGHTLFYIGIVILHANEAFFFLVNNNTHMTHSRLMYMVGNVLSEDELD